MHVVSVNGRTIHHNALHGTNFPILACVTVANDAHEKPTHNEYGHEIKLFHLGEEIGRFVYDDGNRLPCGARCWCELEDSVRVEVIKHGEN